MEIGISTAAFYGRYETEESARFISTLGVDCAEAFLQTPSEYTRDFARVVRQELDGVPCTSVHPLGVAFEGYMFSRSPRQREDHFNFFRRVLDAGAELGASCYVYHGKSTPQLRKLPWNLQMNADILGPMCEEAAQRGMTVAWENVFWCQLTCAERVLEAKAALPQVRFTLDIKQAMRAEADSLALARAMGDQLVNVHICDYTKDGRLCLPGEGDYDFAALREVLREIGYRGPVVLEPYLELISSDEALEKSIAFTRKIMGKA